MSSMQIGRHYVIPRAFPYKFLNSSRSAPPAIFLFALIALYIIVPGSGGSIELLITRGLLKCI